MSDINPYCNMSTSHKHEWRTVSADGVSRIKCRWCGVYQPLPAVVTVAPEIIPTKVINNKFITVIPVYNAEKWIKKCVDSVKNQTYRNHYILVIDDCSTDNTAEVIKTLGVDYIINTERIGKMANLVKGYANCSGVAEDILVELDGDDWLADNKVFAYLNEVYQDLKIWLTYGQFTDLAGGDFSRYSKPLVKTDNYRKQYSPGTWKTSALRTYKKRIWDKIKDEDLRDKKGEYYKWTNDIFRMFPMVEMCGPNHIKCIDKVLYVYNNLNPLNENKVNAPLQLATAKQLRLKKEYKELDLCADKSSAWHLKRIPKIAYFYWGNTELPYLRFLSVYSFCKFNPDWKIKVYYPVEFTKKNSWNTHENQHEFTGGDYWYQLKALNVELVEYNMELLQVHNTISEVFKSEFLKQYLSGVFGGVWIDMDIIFFKSMNHLSVNTPSNANVTNVISINEKYGHSVGFSLSSPDNDYHCYFLQHAKKTFDETKYQGIGPDMMNRVCPTFKSIKEKFPQSEAINMSIDTVYAYDFNYIDKIYNSPDMDRFTKNSIGLHWYGGYPGAGTYINSLTQFDYKNHDNVLCKTIDLMYKNEPEIVIKPKVSLLLPCYNRAELLDLGLHSISQQKRECDLEILVLNDGLPDDTEAVCKKYPKLNIRYIFTGKRNLRGKPIWRVGGFALNVGIKQALGDVIILANSEILHMDNVIDEIIKPLRQNYLSIGVPSEIVMDQKGDILKYYKEYKKPNIPESLLISEDKPMLKYRIELPYFLAVEKKNLLAIGGYDEDFIGFAGEDDDIRRRFKLYGMNYVPINNRVVHMYHTPSAETSSATPEARKYNLELLKQRAKIVKRNVGREWGVL